MMLNPGLSACCLRVFSLAISSVSELRERNVCCGARRSFPRSTQPRRRRCRPCRQCPARRSCRRQRRPQPYTPRDWRPVSCPIRPAHRPRRWVVYPNARYLFLFISLFLLSCFTCFYHVPPENTINIVFGHCRVRFFVLIYRRTCSDATGTWSPWRGEGGGIRDRDRLRRCQERFFFLSRRLSTLLLCPRLPNKYLILSFCDSWIYIFIYTFTLHA